MTIPILKDSDSLPMPASWRCWWALTVVYLVWGSNFLAVDVAVHYLDPLAAGGIRFAVAGLLLYAIASRSEARPTWSDWRAAGRIGLLLFVGASGLLFWGFRYVSSGVGAVLIATVPFWLISFDIAARRIQATMTMLIALTVGLAGVAIVAIPTGNLEAKPRGVVLILGAACLWAVGSIQTRAHPVQISNTTFAAMQMLMGGIGLGALGGLGIAIGLTSLGTLTSEAFWAMIWLIGPSAMLGFGAYTTALRIAPPTAVAIYPYVNTVVAVVLGWLILNEPITGRLVFGTAFILGSVLTVTLLPPVMPNRQNEPPTSVSR